MKERGIMATIVEAIKTVLTQYPDGLTSSEIYEKIIENNLYVFNAIIHILIMIIKTIQNMLVVLVIKTELYVVVAVV